MGIMGELNSKNGEAGSFGYSGKEYHAKSIKGAATYKSAMFR